MVLGAACSEASSAPSAATTASPDDSLPGASDAGSGSDADTNSGGDANAPKPVTDASADASNVAPNSWGLDAESWTGTVQCTTGGGFFYFSAASADGKAVATVTFHARPTASGTFTVKDATDNIFESEVVVLLDKTITAPGVDDRQLTYRATTGVVQVVVSGDDVMATWSGLPAKETDGDVPPSGTLRGSLQCP